MIKDKGDEIMNYNEYLLMINLLINLSPIIGYPIIKNAFSPLNGMKFQIMYYLSLVSILF